MAQPNEKDDVIITPPPAEMEDQGEEFDLSDFVKACKTGDSGNVKSLLESTIDEQDFESLYRGLIVASKLEDEKKKRGVIKVIVDEKGIENIRNSKGDSLFRKVIKDKPDVAGLMLDECCSFEKEKLLVKFKLLRTGGRSIFNIWSEKQIQSVLELMYEQDKESESDLLLHPVVRSLLNRKWSTYMVKFFFCNLGLYLVFLSFLTAFALHVPNPQLIICTGNGTANATASSCGFSSRRRSFLVLAALFTIFFSVLRILLEVCQIFQISNIMKVLMKRPGYKNLGEKGMGDWIIKWKYFTSITNYVEIPLYTFSVIFVNVMHRECLCPSRGQWQIGTIAVFLAWVDLLLFMNKWPDLGIYISMLWRIILNFLKVSIIALFLIIAFGFAFYMAFYEPDLPDTPFESPIVTFVTMISYAISSPDISIFRLSNDDTKMDAIPYPELSYFIWILFGIIMSILFLNFLVGLAVDDVQALRREANKERIKLLINLFIDVEETLNILRLLLRMITRNKCPGLFQNTGTPDITGDSIPPQSFSVRLGICWGDDMRNIISSAKKKKDEIEKKTE